MKPVNQHFNTVLNFFIGSRFPQVFQIGNNITAVVNNFVTNGPIHFFIGSSISVNKADISFVVSMVAFRHNFKNSSDITILNFSTGGKKCFPFSFSCNELSLINENYHLRLFIFFGAAFHLCTAKLFYNKER
jgi:hypothetical protein